MILIIIDSLSFQNLVMSFQLTFWSAVIFPHYIIEAFWHCGRMPCLLSFQLLIMIYCHFSIHYNSVIVKLLCRVLSMFCISTFLSMFNDISMFLSTFHYISMFLSMFNDIWMFFRLLTIFRRFCRRLTVFRHFVDV